MPPKRQRTVRRAVQATRRVAGRLANQFIQAQTGINLNKLAKTSGRRSRTAAVATSDRQRVNEPVISQFRRGIRVRHREYIGPVVNYTAYTANTDYILNPADMTTFPWLSTQAKSWEKYRFLSLAFEYVPRCSTATTGQVLMVPIYDSKMQSPATEVEATSHVDTVEDVVWNGLRCQLSPQRLGEVRYVQTTIQAGDVRTSNAGKFLVATVGATTNAQEVGKLWVEYEVELLIPLTIPVTPTCCNITMYYMTAAMNTAVTGDFPLTTTWALAHDGLDIDRYMTSATTNGLFMLPRGSYMVDWQIGWYNNTGEQTTVSGYFASTTVQDYPTTVCSDTRLAIANARETLRGSQVINTAGNLDYWLGVDVIRVAGTLNFIQYSNTSPYCYIVFTPI